MKTRIPIVDPCHHRIPLKVKCFIRLPGLLLISFLKCSLTRRRLLLEPITQDLLHIVRLLSEVLQLAHPSLVVSAHLAYPSELEDSYLFFVVEVQVSRGVVEAVGALSVTV